MTSTITIPVDAATALEYREAPAELQEQIQTTIREQLAKAKKQRAWDQFMQACAVLSAQAQSNGMTPEILEEILRDE